MTIQRGLLLYQQSRYDLAETELRRALGTEPEDPYAHALLALTLIERRQLDDAVEEARQAIQLAPDYAFAYYAMAKVQYERDRYPQAEELIRQAIERDPAEPDYRFLLSAIHFDQRHWDDALREAEQGLALDPEHSGCTNLRAMALVKLGRTREATDTIDAALAKDPENTSTHANRGWTLLEQGNHADAQTHFREALRLDPQNEWARAGIIEALKARNPIYAFMLRYFLWMGKLSERAQWGVIFGGYLINRVLTASARANPELAPWLLPFRVVFGLFILLTWIADPLFNLVLRLDEFGRLALTEEQIRESNWVGTATILAALSLGACFVWGFDGPFVVAAVVFGPLIVPIAGTFKIQEPRSRRMMAVYTGVLAALGLSALVLAVAVEGEEEPEWMLLVPFLIGVFASGWIANALASRRAKR